MADTRLEIACQQIQFARNYTLMTLEDIALDDWFRCPSDVDTHVAWQVGHLAMAEYGLTMLRLRGKQPEDAEFITNDFIRCFKKGSTPIDDRSAYPAAEEIRTVLDAVHARSQEELAGYTEAELEERLPEPHALFDTKLGSVFFCSNHEMLHAGQIGLLRRALGKPPLR